MSTFIFYFYRSLCDIPYPLLHHIVSISVFYRMAVKAAKAREKLKLRDPAVVVNRIDNVSKVYCSLSAIDINLFIGCISIDLHNLQYIVLVGISVFDTR